MTLPPLAEANRCLGSLDISAQKVKPGWGVICMQVQTHIAITRIDTSNAFMQGPVRGMADMKSHTTQLNLLQGKRELGAGHHAHPSSEEGQTCGARHLCLAVHGAFTSHVIGMKWPDPKRAGVGGCVRGE
eukprot:1148880-Pelagomonas_calceolata.AAC.7